MFNLCDVVIDIIKRWKPIKYPNEEGYKVDLYDFLRGEFEKSKQKPFGLKEVPLIRIDKGGVFADIEIARTIGIELKYNLEGKKEIECLIGRIDGYEREQYNCIITVLCGEMSDETAKVVEERKTYLPKFDV